MAMLEVEMKFPVPDFAGLEASLLQRAARQTGDINEADHYFNAPDRDFAQTDEALRVRRIGDANFVTYKGPKRDAQTKTRTEIEVPIGGGDMAADSFMQILQKLGYRPSGVVRKRRRLFHLPADGEFTVEVCLDEVEHVGTYAELEIVASEDKLEPARDLLLRLAAELGFTTSERRSYLQMMLLGKGDK